MSFQGSFKGFRLAVGSESHLATGRARFKGRAPLRSTTECGRIRRGARTIVVHTNPRGSGDVWENWPLLWISRGQPCGQVGGAPKVKGNRGDIEFADVSCLVGSRIQPRNHPFRLQ